MSIEERLDRIESKLAIQEVIYKYSQGFDHQNRAMLRSIWTDDAVLELGPLLGRYETADGIMKGAEELWAFTPRMYHWMENSLIEVDGDSATAETDLDAFVINSDDGPTQLVGHYSDRLVRQGGVWRIRYREFDLYHWAPLPGWSATKGSHVG